MTGNGHFPLSKIKILDLTRARAGPTAVRQLVDWGADAIKIEMPGGRAGDGMGGNRHGFDFQNLHRNKRGMSLNLKHPKGVEIFKQLARDADVIVENYRADVKHRLGIDYEAIRQINPRMVYGSISGFGQEGPYRDRPGGGSDCPGDGRVDVHHGLARPGPGTSWYSGLGFVCGHLLGPGYFDCLAGAGVDRRGQMGIHIAIGSDDVHARFPSLALDHGWRSRSAGGE